MVNRKIWFKDIPFVPLAGQVIYFESKYNKSINEFILSNYDELCYLFKRYDLEFCYLPLISLEFLSYQAPYLTETQRERIVHDATPLKDYLLPDQEIGPSLIFSSDSAEPRADGLTAMTCVSLKKKWYVSRKRFFEQVVREISRHTRIKREKVVEECEVMFSCVKRDDLFWENRKQQSPYVDKFSPEEPKQIIHEEKPEPPPFDADEEFDKESKRLIREIKQRIEALRNRGVNTMFLHKLIDDGEHLSRLRITKDYRIFLVDYNNMEICMSALPKAVFILFLRHTEGILFKELADYSMELLEIYKALGPIGDDRRHQMSINRIVNPLNNSINENCARVREAFVSVIDDRLAQHYYITGTRGEPKRIMLDQQLIIWE